MFKADYAEGLSIRLADLSDRLRRLGYRPKPARRAFIPKANGGQRALGGCKPETTKIPSTRFQPRLDRIQERSQKTEITIR